MASIVSKKQITLLFGPAVVGGSSTAAIIPIGTKAVVTGLYMICPGTLSAAPTPTVTGLSGGVNTQYAQITAPTGFTGGTISITNGGRPIGPVIDATAAEVSVTVGGLWSIADEIGLCATLEYID